MAALLATLTGTLFGPAGAVLDPSGNLDTGFGGEGHSVTNFSQVDTFAEARGVALQTGVHEGKIVLAGGYQDGFDSHLALLRLNPDGTQDMSFGSGGEVKTVVGGNDLAYDVAIQPDNKIVVVGDSDRDFLVARYSPDGVLDDTFGGGDGIVTAGVMVGGFDRAHAVALQPDGRIVVVGYSDVAAGDIRDVSLMRFNPDGALDPTFGGGDGKATVNLHDTGAERLNDLAIQPDGKIVAAGEARLATGTCNT
ncbi:MAG: calcium-binding protein, partial [Acidimicrobiia bacterium]